ncbi:hypothetical protein C8R44DRAFT_794377 [Mycena epipterygia]|nr:hypothetical protein C8R44DRAFT_794377 [Mycena epipterygia]
MRRRVRELGGMSKDDEDTEGSDAEWAEQEGGCDGRECRAGGVWKRRQEEGRGSDSR